MAQAPPWYPHPREKNNGPSLLNQRLLQADARWPAGQLLMRPMSPFDSLTWAFEDWFDTPLGELPAPLRQRVEQGAFPISWDSLSPDQRRSLALQLDYQHDPATGQDQKFWWDFFERKSSLKVQVAEWEKVAAPTAADLALKETRLFELKQEIARMDVQQRLARGDYYPEKRTGQNHDDTSLAEPLPAARYVAYPKAMHQFTERLGATPEELAAWIWCGPEDGGIAAYMNANELDPPPQFFYTTGSDNQDYIAPLMACWFKANDIDQFEPAERYITGAALIERWSQRHGLHPVAFIHAKIAESRLLDIHPIYGGTRGTFSEHSDWPPLESGLFPLSHVEQIEAEDFAEFSSTNKTVTAAQVANGLNGTPHIQALPPTSEPKKPQGSTVRREARKLATQALHKEWQKAYRVLIKSRPNRSDVWYSQQIAKLPTAKRSAETIRKHMKP